MLNNNQKNDLTEKQKKDVENQIALFVVQNYSGAEVIDFENFRYNDKTGAWHVSAKVNETNMITFSMENINKISSNTIGTRVNPSTFNLKKEKNEGKRLTDIKIVGED